MKMIKKIWVFLGILAIVLGTSCKKKVETVVEEAPQVQKVENISEAAFLKNASSGLEEALDPGEKLTVKVDPGTVVGLNQSSFTVSLFPVKFIHPAEEKYVKKYLLPSVVIKFASGAQLPYSYLPEYLNDDKEGLEIWLLKECADPNIVYEHVPTLLFEGANGYFKVTDQNGDEMFIRPEWAG